MVMITLQHNRSNLKSSFLIEFLDKMIKLPRGRGLSQDRVTSILTEITSRYDTDAWIPKNTNKLLDIMRDCRTPHLPLLACMEESYINDPNSGFNVVLFEYLATTNHDLTNLLNAAEEKKVFATARRNLLVRLHVLLRSCRQRDNYTKWIQLIEENTEFQNKEPTLYVDYVTASPFLKYDKDILSELIKTYVLEKDDTRVWLENAFNLCVSNKMAGEITKQVAEVKAGTLNNAGMFRMLNRSLWKKRGPNSSVLHSIILYLGLLKTNPGIFHAPTFISDLSNNGKLAVDLAVNAENQFKNAIKLCRESLEATYGDLNPGESDQPMPVENLRPDGSRMTIPVQVLIETFSVAQRLEQNGYYIRDLGYTMKFLYTQFKLAGKNLNLELESNICDFLVQHKLIDVEYAEEMFEKTKGKNFVSMNTKTRYFTYYLRRKLHGKRGAQSVAEDGESPAEHEQTPEQEALVEEAKLMIEDLEGKLQDVDAKLVLNSLAQLLSFPHELISHNKDLYLTAMKDQLSFGNSNLYMEIINSIPESEMHKNRSFYVPFIRELSDYYANFSRRLRVVEICGCLEKFTKFKLPRSHVYNSILGDIARNFNVMRNEDFVKVTASFARMNLKQTDLFDKILTKVSQNFGAFMPFWVSLVINLFRVNYDSNLYKEKINEWVDYNRVGAPIQLFLVRTILAMEPENEEELLTKVFNNLAERDLSGIKLNSTTENLDVS